MAQIFSLLFQTRHFKSSPEQSSKVEKLRSGAEEFLDKTLGTDATLIFSPSQVCNSGPRSSVCNVSGNKCVSDCRSRGWITARSHTFVEIDYEIISTVILLPSAESFKKDCYQVQEKACAQSTGQLLVQACPGKRCG